MAPPRDLILGITPLGRPDAQLAIAITRAGGIGVLDLGANHRQGLAALASIKDSGAKGFGVLISRESTFKPADLPDCVETVVLEAGVPLKPWAGRRTLVQCVSLDEARKAAADGAEGIIAKGSESGGRVGDESAFVLLQRLVDAVELPVWVQGGIGLHTAGACIVGGARGVVLDAQLALLAESTLDAAGRASVASLDGSETAVVDGRRVLIRPGPLSEEKPAGSEDPALSGVVSLGQDAAFAHSIAERYATVPRFMRALQAAIADALIAARDELPLQPRSAFAEQHGLRCPIAQGPMTRVSDTADFAAAVAAGGALPFLALALMRGPEVRRLLQETAARLEGQTWGVGILGFVPPELREEQIEIIREVKPPVALIAGGRPSQAKPLEELGIPTYLHVPSPGLLDMFLKQGARRFVFEGQECGGHIGPRTSFVLWQQQVERLMAFEAPHELSVLFAGGVHDARSAAMVSALVAPLARRGAKVGVLMGTAYLFTREAVASGAILPGFQAAAMTCEGTTLLETAPGHSTRCADTPYVSTFLSERERMTREGVPAQEMWEALETLNLGRLRIASKGLAREGESIVSVDESVQREQGMVMLGQVAALRSELTSIEALHEDVSEGATRVLDALDTRPYERDPGSRDVAIVGMAAIMPKASELADFWSNIVKGVDCITEVPPERWNAGIFYDPASKDGEKTPSKWGGFIDPVAFDPLQYGIPPLTLAAIEPVQLLSLEVSRRALADAGYVDRPFDRERTSVIFGAEAGSDLSSAYGFRTLWRQYVGEVPPELEAVLPTMTEDSFAGILSNVISGRIANRLDLGGVNFTVDAACAASLAAVNLAMGELAAGTSDMVICGGADLHNGIVDYLAFSSTHALGSSGRCRTFDASADGIALGEGVAAVVLKRLADAERDGDRIYAVVKAVGGASDGKSLGLTAPRAQGQVRTLDRAYRQAGVSPGEVELVEAHGTGTVVGDRTELESLSLVFSRGGPEPGSITLGSVKSQIGHTKCTAGIAGLIKVSLSLHNRVLPATLNIEQPNPGWDPSSPFSLNTSPRPWIGSKRKAGVSAFGFGGTNFHAVVEEYEAGEPGHGYDVWPSELFLFRGHDAEAAVQRIAELSRLLDRDESWRLRDLARSTSAGSEPVQIAVVANDLEDLRSKLAKAAALQADPAGVFVATDALGREAKVAFLYPGQGSQAPGMLRDLFIAFPDLQRYLALDPGLAKIMFPPTAWDDATREAQRAAITDTRAAQPALGIAAMTVTDLLQRLGLSPDVVAGHSYGELAALTAAGVFDPADLVDLSERRAACILDAATTDGDTGAMAAVRAAPEQIRPYVEGIDNVVMANLNTGEQTVISGATAGVATAVEQMRAAGLAARPLEVACAFHSPIVAGAAETFLAALKAVEVRPPNIPVYSNAGGDRFPDEPDAIRKRLARQIAEPVEFQREVEAMYADGVRVFVEAGPGRVLTGLADRILGDRPHVCVAVDAGGQHGVTQLLRALAQLAVAGVGFECDRLYEHRSARLFDLAEAPSTRPAETSWWVNGQRAWPVRGEPPAHAMLPVPQPLPIALGNAAPAVIPEDAGREAVVLEYLRNVRDLVDTQRRVMLGYLGVDAAAAEYAYQPKAPRALPATSNGAKVNGHRPADPRPAAQSPAPAIAPPAQIDTAQVLLTIISERTGYPVEMLGLDLDLEADLGIDSIKRIEILGSLAERLGAADAFAELPDDLVRVKTLRAIIDTLTVLIAKPAATPQLVAAAAGGAYADPEPHVTSSEVIDTHTALLELVSARTGYPVEMLDPSLDLEADLSIDSIKRIEILGALVERLGVGAQAAFQDVPEELVRVKTLQGIIDALANVLPGAVTTPAASPAAPVVEAPAVTLPEEEAKGPVPRYGLIERPAELSPTFDIEGSTIAIVGEDSVRTALKTAAEAAGAHVIDGAAASLVDLSALDAAWQPEALVPLFERLRDALAGGAQRLLVVSTAANQGGIAGMARSLAKEWPDRTVRAVIFDGIEDPHSLARQVLAELSASGPVVVSCTADGRFERTAYLKPLEESSSRLELDSDSVVLLTGGARGITATIARALAARFGCKIELIGRTPEPAGDEEPDVAAALDLPSLRRAVIARGELREPAAIEAAVARIVAAREVRATLAALREAGASVRYHACDVRDPEAFAAAIDGVYERHGRIDLVVHGAGVIEDRLAVDKTAESFRRVLETKVIGAQTLAAKLRDDVRCLVFFSSVAGAFGNRGQVDYATANDYLDGLAIDLNRERTGRVVSIAWGPWADGGMVSPELEREYATRGIELIEPEGGVEAFLSEVLTGPKEDAHVLLMRAFPSSLS